MARKWTDFTRREKVIGILIAVFAVFAIGGAASAAVGNNSTADSSENTIPARQAVTPEITYRNITVEETIPFLTESKNDNTLNSGTTKVVVSGVDGVRARNYKLTLSDGKEIARELLSVVTVTEPITEVTAIGTYVAPKPAEKPKVSSSCDPNYSGACVPIASDVDCAGGTGNGPAYVGGPVYVIGTDIYGLDRDGDGVGCES
ncbi:MAG: G5 domain-containing protein [Candidatus Microsaccharimonas sp.]